MILAAIVVVALILLLGLLADSDDEGTTFRVTKRVRLRAATPRKCAGVVPAKIQWVLRGRCTFGERRRARRAAPSSGSGGRAVPGL